MRSLQRLSVTDCPHVEKEAFKAFAQAEYAYHMNLAELKLEFERLVTGKV